MAAWKKAVVVALVALVGFVPAFTQLGYAQTLPEAVPVLPSGEELPNEELLEVKGESPVLVVLAIGAAAAGCAAVYEAFFDEDYGLDWDDARAIILHTVEAMLITTLGLGLGGGGGLFNHPCMY